MSTDQELFDAAISSEPMQEAPAEPAAAPGAPAAVARDDAGRFAAKPGDEPSAGEAAPAGAPVEPPPHRFREVSERARAAEARAAELERMLLRQNQPEPTKVEPPPKPQVWDNPDQWGQGLIDPVKAELSESLYRTREFFSHREAVREHGAEKVNEAARVFNEMVQSDTHNGPGAVQHIRASLDPVGEVMNWYEQHLERQDPDLARRRSVERMLADPAQRELVAQMLGTAAAPASPAASPQAQGGSVVRIPPSLNRTTSAASNATSGSGDQPIGDDALFNQITSSRRR